MTPGDANLLQSRHHVSALAKADCFGIEQENDRENSILAAVRHIDCSTFAVDGVEVFPSPQNAAERTSVREGWQRISVTTGSAIKQCGRIRHLKYSPAVLNTKLPML